MDDKLIHSYFLKNIFYSKEKIVDLYMSSKKKFKEKKVSLVIDTYGNYEVVIIITDDIQKSRDRLNDEIGFICDLEIDVDGLHSYNSSQMKSYILVNSDSTNGVIAHESFHCVSRIMRCIGGKLSRKSEESYAYLLTYIVDTIQAIINK